VSRPELLIENGKAWVTKDAWSLAWQSARGHYHGVHEAWLTLGWAWCGLYRIPVYIVG